MAGVSLKSRGDNFAVDLIARNIFKAVNRFEEMFSRAPVYDVIFSALSQRSILHSSQTCRLVCGAAQQYQRRAFSIHRHLFRFFDDTPGFRSLQARTGTLISGSNALQFFDRTFYPESDLDLYVHPGHVREVLDWLVKTEHYEFIPRPRQPDDYRRLAPDNWDGTQRPTLVQPDNDPLDMEPYAMKGVKGVYTFSKATGSIPSDGEEKLVVQVMETKTNPLEAILNFHLSCVMNIIAFDAAYSLYPRATFCERSALQMREPGDGEHALAMAKYSIRGWTLLSKVLPTNKLFKPYKMRSVGDSFTWTIPLDITGVQLRPALTPNSKIFTWDPVVHNSWKLKYGRTKMYADYRPVVSTRFRYNYLATDEDLFKAMSAFLTAQVLLFSPAEKDNWTWWDYIVPMCREQVVKSHDPVEATTDALYFMSI
ncbi:hypothetical protein BJ138DRAFT_1139306 [Hygrophoropsis aurantiaca]|uniref:Uncharacterized protein n=1 Tax=Hygrophoropsis aurantiaca TaxID=72124 RepID=A0ACB8AUM7_9AGAM|nr:hypothetical protein BJ138DRAFT_1139306 [Hygrophoropsis aurantiaca]